MNHDLDKQALHQALNDATQPRRLARACGFLLNQDGATALEQHIALLATRCATRPVFEPARLRDARIATACGALLLAAAAAVAGIHAALPTADRDAGSDIELDDTLDR